MTRSFTTRKKQHNFTDLGSLKSGQKAIVTGVQLPLFESTGHARKLAVRLNELDLVGAPVKVLPEDSESDGPISISVHGSILSLRRRDAKHIKVVVEIL